MVLVGEPGTGKRHLATGLCVAAYRQRRRARFTTATALVNELVEAKHADQLSRALDRWSRFELIVIDERGYVLLAEVGAATVSGDRRPRRKGSGGYDDEYTPRRV